MLGLVFAGLVILTSHIAEGHQALLAVGIGMFAAVIGVLLAAFALSTWVNRYRMVEATRLIRAIEDDSPQCDLYQCPGCRRIHCRTHQKHT